MIKNEKRLLNTLKYKLIYYQYNDNVRFYEMIITIYSFS